MRVYRVTKVYYIFLGRKSCDGKFSFLPAFFCCGNAAGRMNGTFIFWISWFEAFKGLKQRVFFFHGIQSLSFKDCFPYES